MKISKACAIFENIDSPDFTDLEKGEAIYEVLKMPTHNSITKDKMLNVIKWLFDKVHICKSGKKCLFPDCETITNSKYGLCAKHYRRQWDRLKKGAISDMHDFSQSKRKLSDETKEKLRECAIKQRRINGKFASNIHDNPELLKGD